MDRVNNYIEELKRNTDDQLDYLYERLVPIIDSILYQNQHNTNDTCFPILRTYTSRIYFNHVCGKYSDHIDVYDPNSKMVSKLYERLSREFNIAHNSMSHIDVNLCFVEVYLVNPFYVKPQEHYCIIM
jgi:hypothetical protein